MSIELIMVLVMVGFVLLVLLEVPVGFSLAVAGTMGIIIFRGPDVAARVVASAPYSASAKYVLFVIPMFILLGSLIANSGIGEQIYRSAARGLRRLPGGLAATTVMATAIFSGISGSSAADVATIGRIANKEMRRHGYNQNYAAAIIAAAGTFAMLIPPSVVLVLYGIIAEESISKLLLAGIIPGFLSCFILVVAVILKSVIWPEQPAASGDILPESASSGHPDASADNRQKNSLAGIFYAGIIFSVVLGGIYFGIFTTTEAAAVGAFAALIIAIVARSQRSMPLSRLLSLAIRETASTTSMIFVLLIGGYILNYLVAAGSIPARIAEWIVTLPVSPEVIVALFLLVLLPLGMVLDGMTLLLVVVPIAHPIVTELGFDGIWFAILVVKMIEIGLITPPVGLNVFVIAGLDRRLNMERVFAAVLPFVVLDLLVTALFFFFPPIITWLPSLMK